MNSYEVISAPNGPPPIKRNNSGPRIKQDIPWVDDILEIPPNTTRRIAVHIEEVDRTVGDPEGFATACSRMLREINKGKFDGSIPFATLSRVDRERGCLLIYRGENVCVTHR